MGVVAEGFQDPLREHHLGSVLAKLAQAAQKATDAPTGECLCFAYGQLAEHCQPEIIGHSNAVIPVVFEFLNDQRAAVRRGVPFREPLLLRHVGTACYVLETFCESMDSDQLQPLLEPLLMCRLVPLLDHRLLGIREMGGGRRFGSSRGVGQVRSLSGRYGAATSGHGRARGRTGLGAAWEVSGSLGTCRLAVVGNAKFSHRIETRLRAAAANLELDSTELAEYSYGFFANCAKVMRSDFGSLAAAARPASAGRRREKGRGVLRLCRGRRRGRRRVQRGLLEMKGTTATSGADISVLIST